MRGLCGGGETFEKIMHPEAEMDEGCVAQSIWSTDADRFLEIVQPFHLCRVQAHENNKLKGTSVGIAVRSA